MRDEECDWCVYHLVAGQEATSLQALERCTGLSREILEASVDRLVRARLIERCGDCLRALSLPEMVILQQMENDPELPLIIEQGIIKMPQGRRN